MNQKEFTVTEITHREISRFPAETPVAMAYIPFQSLGQLYSDDEALMAGTLFPSWISPSREEGLPNERKRYAAQKAFQRSVRRMGTENVS